MIYRHLYICQLNHINYYLLNLPKIEQLATDEYYI